MKNNLLSYDLFRGGVAWILLFLGIGFYACGYFWVPQGSIWKEIIIKIADVLVIGVILGYLSNAAQFLGVFKKDLQDIIYGKDFIKQRKDLDTLWETITKQMFKNKFPAIHKDLLEIINGYLPTEEVSYYNDYSTHITIEWVDFEKNIIRQTDIVDFELISDATNSFTYPLKSWVNAKDSSAFTNRIEDITVNGKEPELGEKKTYKDKGVFCEEQPVILKDATKYEMQYKRVRVFCLDDDNYIGFRAHYIVNKLRVCLDFPENLEVLFTCRGTTKDFEDVSQTKSCIEKKYKGIILPRQGFLFTLRKK